MKNLFRLLPVDGVNLPILQPAFPQCCVKWLPKPSPIWLAFLSFSKSARITFAFLVPEVKALAMVTLVVPYTKLWMMDVWSKLVSLLLDWHLAVNWDCMLPLLEQLLTWSLLKLTLESWLILEEIKQSVAPYEFYCNFYVSNFDSASLLQSYWTLEEYKICVRHDWID